jgi:hypothetical protein
MKALARILVVVAVICLSLFAVHGFYLVRADLAKQKVPIPTASPTTTPTPSALVEKPSPTPTKTKPTAAPASDSDAANGDPEAEAKSAAEWQAQQERTPETHSTTVSFMPAQTADIKNQKFRKVLIRSEYPLRILTGHCRADATVEFFCNGDPGDIFISDTRHVPLIMTPHANSITITVTEF